MKEAMLDAIDKDLNQLKGFAGGGATTNEILRKIKDAGNYPPGVTALQAQSMLEAVLTKLKGFGEVGLRDGKWFAS